MGVEIARLAFWKTKADCKKDAAAIYQELSAKRPVSCLEELPTQKVLEAVKQLYPKLRVTNSHAEIDLPRQETEIAILWSKKHIEFVFYGDAFRQMDRIVKVMTKLRLPCFEVGVKMHSLDEPPQFDPGPNARKAEKAWEEVLDNARARIWPAAINPMDRIEELAKFAQSKEARREFEELCARRGIKLRPPKEVEINGRRL